MYIHASLAVASSAAFITHLHALLLTWVHIGRVFRRTYTIAMDGASSLILDQAATATASHRQPLKPCRH